MEKDIVPNNNIPFTITDDDGVSYVKVSLYESDETTLIKEIEYDAEDTKLSTSYGGAKLNLPEAFGNYYVVVSTKDKTYDENNKNNR